MRLLRSLACAVVLAGIVSQLPGQRTWIVDSRGGGHFLDLPPAVAAAADGDVIRVRATPIGYNLFTTSKGLTILAEDYALAVGSQNLVIQNLPAGRQFTMVAPRLAPSSLTIQACQGRVLLAEMGVPGTVTITDAVSVHLHRFSTTPGPMVVTRSHIVLVDASLAGGLYPTSSQSTLQATDATLEIAGGSCSGAWSTTFPYVPAPSAITATRCALTIRGAARIMAGFSLTGPLAAGIVGNGGTLVHDPALVQITGSPAIQGSVVVAQQRLPALSLTSLAPVSARLLAPAGHVVVFLASLAGDPITMGNIGTVWLDPALLVSAGNAVVDPSQQVDLNLPVVPDPTLTGLTFALQALDVPTTGPMFWSNPIQLAFR